MIPRAKLITPNRFEAERLSGVKVDGLESAAEAIHHMTVLGAKHVLVKLGDIDGKSQHMLGLEEHNVGFALPRLDASNTHGTGCILSACIAGRIALGQVDLFDAVNFAIQQTWQAIAVNTKRGKGIYPAETRAVDAPVLD